MILNERKPTCHVTCHGLLPYSLYPVLCTVALILPSISLLVLILSLSFPITTQEQLTNVSCLLTYNYLLTDLLTSSLAFSSQFSTLQRHFSKIKSSGGPPFFKILQSSPFPLDKEWLLYQYGLQGPDDQQRICLDSLTWRLLPSSCAPSLHSVPRCWWGSFCLCIGLFSASNSLCTFLSYPGLSTVIKGQVLFRPCWISNT